MCWIRAVVLTFLFVLGASAQISINNLVVFARPYGATITTIKASPVGPCIAGNVCTGFPNGAGIQNKGQGGHLLVVTLPGAVADVAALQVRLEASYTCPDPPVCAAGSWFPISPDITTATFFSGVGAINVVKSNGAFPYVRANSLTNTPAAEPMEIRYSGFPFPIGSASIGSGGVVNILFIGPVTGPTSTSGNENHFVLVEGNTTVGQCAVFQSDGNVIGALCSGSGQIHVITFIIDGGGSAITTGDTLTYPSVNFSCTINKAMISADVSGSITVDVWKRNAAIPTSAQKISASAPVTLSASQLNQNSALTGWTTSVVANDVFGFSVASASTVTRVIGQLWCN